MSNYNDAPFFTVILPFPPTQNQSLKGTVNKKTGKPMFYDDPEVKKWKAEAEAACASAHIGMVSVFIGDIVQMHIAVYPPDNRADIDGIEKKIMDCLQGHAYTNDRQVYKKTTERTLWVNPTEPRVVVRVWEFGKPFPLRYELSPNAK
jgi:Holliday junction resolvase RusA-like endonuclease